MKRYLALTTILGGSSYAIADTPTAAAEHAKRILDIDWKQYRNPSDPASFVIYELTEGLGWYADRDGVFDSNGTRLTRIDKIQF